MIRRHICAYVTFIVGEEIIPLQLVAVRPLIPSIYFTGLEAKDQSSSLALSVDLTWLMGSHLDTYVELLIDDIFDGYNRGVDIEGEASRKPSAFLHKASADYGIFPG